MYVLRRRGARYKSHGRFVSVFLCVFPCWAGGNFSTGSCHGQTNHNPCSFGGLISILEIQKRKQQNVPKKQHFVAPAYLAKLPCLKMCASLVILRQKATEDVLTNQVHGRFVREKVEYQGEKQTRSTTFIQADTHFLDMS